MNFKEFKFYLLWSAVPLIIWSLLWAASLYSISWFMFNLFWLFYYGLALLGADEVGRRNAVSPLLEESK